VKEDFSTRESRAQTTHIESPKTAKKTHHIAEMGFRNWPAFCIVVGIFLCCTVEKHWW
jgi:hypothetical protein